MLAAEDNYILLFKDHDITLHQIATITVIGHISKIHTSKKFSSLDLLATIKIYIYIYTGNLLLSTLPYFFGRV